MISGLCYVLAGVLVEAGLPGLRALPVGVVAMIAFLYVMKRKQEQAA